MNIEASKVESAFFIQMLDDSLGILLEVLLELDVVYGLGRSVDKREGFLIGLRLFWNLGGLENFRIHIF